MNTDKHRLIKSIIFVFFRVFRGHFLLLTVAETAPDFNGIPFYSCTIKLHSMIYKLNKKTDEIMSSLA